MEARNYTDLAGAIEKVAAAAECDPDQLTAALDHPHDMGEVVAALRAGYRSPDLAETRA